MRVDVRAARRVLADRRPSAEPEPEPEPESESVPESESESASPRAAASVARAFVAFVSLTSVSARRPGSKGKKETETSLVPAKQHDVFCFFKLGI